MQCQVRNRYLKNSYHSSLSFQKYSKYLPITFILLYFTTDFPKQRESHSQCQELQMGMSTVFLRIRSLGKPSIQMSSLSLSLSFSPSLSHPGRLVNLIPGKKVCNGLLSETISRFSLYNTNLPPYPSLVLPHGSLVL